MVAKLRVRLTDLDAMVDKAFEFALRDLLIRDGWTARVVGQKGDQVADVIGDHERRGRIVLQAKHTRVGSKVSSSGLYQVKGTARPVHRADHAVVVTNADFTRDAKAWGDQHHIHWTDWARLQAWAELGTPLHDLLRPARATTATSGETTRSPQTTTQYRIEPKPAHSSRRRGSADTSRLVLSGGGLGAVHSPRTARRFSPHSARAIHQLFHARTNNSR
ncbi:restriction endonuclease [Streptomyces specialis]|uniref:restriction endonuclease n=1 Tax=Streptomyces specialis TaxID=498367 RepID=UPI002D219BCA|nr:restriction endonuclease [Streptomyces specialis]